MPLLSEDQVKAKIGDGSIFGISVDTSVFDKYGCNLSFAALRKLNQFREGEVRVVLSKIVVDEIQSHIGRDAAETQRVLKKALRAHGKRWQLNEADAAPPAGLQMDADPAEAASQQVEEFISEIAAEIVPGTKPDGIAEEVLRRYFAPEPPFKTGEKKKHEFPDAFALLSLESRARERGGLLLCVSQDKGWQEFAATSETLVCFDDLERALSLFNEAGRTVAERAVAMLRSGQIEIGEIESAVQARLDDCDFDVDAWSYMDFDIDDQWGALAGIEPSSISSPTVIATDHDSVTFTVDILADVSFGATFSYHVRDSIDRDVVSLGTQAEEVQREIELELAITVSREEESPEILDAEVAKQRIRADFGDLEPFKDEDPTFEKY